MKIFFIANFILVDDIFATVIFDIEFGGCYDMESDPDNSTFITHPDLYWYHDSSFGVYCQINEEDF